jgi:hypothetical protein
MERSANQFDQRIFRVSGYKREGLRLAEIELTHQRERVAELRRHLPEGAPIQDYQFEEGPRDLNAGDGLCTPSAAANFSPYPIARSSSITSCSKKGKLRLARCAPPGSTVLMVSPIISLRILTSLLSLPPISRLCAPTLASGAGTSCVPPTYPGQSGRNL